MTKMAEEILAKDAQTKSEIAADKATILTANAAWNTAATAAANAHIAASNAKRSKHDEEELDKISSMTTELSDTIDSIRANELPGADSIEEANKALDEDKQAFDDALAQSVVDLEATRAEFRTNAGDGVALEISTIAAYDVVGIQS